MCPVFEESCSAVPARVRRRSLVLWVYLLCAKKVGDIQGMLDRCRRNMPRSVCRGNHLFAMATPFEDSVRFINSRPRFESRFSPLRRKKNPWRQSGQQKVVEVVRNESNDGRTGSKVHRITKWCLRRLSAFRPSTGRHVKIGAATHSPLSAAKMFRLHISYLQSTYAEAQKGVGRVRDMDTTTQGYK